MSEISAVFYTFNDLFDLLFKSFTNSEDEYTTIPELPLHLIEDGALEDLKEYCEKHNLFCEIKNTKENAISIKVKA
jgi:hypothetical protein